MSSLLGKTVLPGGTTNYWLHWAGILTGKKPGKPRIVRTAAGLTIRGRARWVIILGLLTDSKDNDETAPHHREVR